MRMLGRLAARFPHHTFFTLGYLSTGEPPAVRMPANTGVIVSAMELPLSAGALKSASGKKFAVRLDGWKDVTDNVYIWDYIQNFDDYLTPFPVLERMGERLRFYRDKGVEGIFLNGSGYDYVPFDDVRTYVLASLLRDPGQPVEALMRRYIAANYPKSGDLLAGFCVQAERRAAASARGLNLYGGIRDAEASWLDAAKVRRLLRRTGARPSHGEGRRAAAAARTVDGLELHAARSGPQPRRRTVRMYGAQRRESPREAAGRANGSRRWRSAPPLPV